MKTLIQSSLAALVFLDLSLTTPKAQAVVPPPDGGYPNFTTAEGTNALKNLTTGAANTAVGWRSLFSDTQGSFNTGVGAGALILNNGGSNTAVGAAALLLNTGGFENTAVGTDAMASNDTGADNTAIGAFALLNNLSGSNNTAVGYLSLRNDSTGSFNTALGAQTLATNTGPGNTAVGAAALLLNATGSNNTAVGTAALANNGTGSHSTAVGDLALSNSNADFNTAIGASAGTSQTTGHNNIYIGDLGVAGENNVIAIGQSASSGTAYTQTYIGGIYGTTSPGGTQVFITSGGQLGTLTSSRRFKEEIKPMDDASELLYVLKPVTFRYKKEIDPAGTSQLGLIAEDVEKMNPDLVVRDKQGKAYSVRYDQVNAMLLNEFLKEHRKVEKLEATVADLAEQLQKITAQMQMKNSSARVAGR